MEPLETLLQRSPPFPTFLDTPGHAKSIPPWIFTALIALAVTLPLLILIMWMRWGEDILDMLDFKDPPTAQGLEQGVTELLSPSLGPGTVGLDLSGAGDERRGVSPGKKANGQQKGKSKKHRGRR
jgi:hypothetical protein